jgi:hypothetical protein
MFSLVRVSNIVTHMLLYVQWHIRNWAQSLVFQTLFNFVNTRTNPQSAVSLYFPLRPKRIKFSKYSKILYTQIHTRFFLDYPSFVLLIYAKCVSITWVCTLMSFHVGDTSRCFSLSWNEFLRTSCFVARLHSTRVSITAGALSADTRHRWSQSFAS